MNRRGFLFESLVSFENLLEAARAMARHKRDRPLVAEFLFNLENELTSLQQEMETGRYCPGRYHRFTIREPKERLISAAPVRDRVVHHAVCQVIEPLFEPRFIYDSYACRRKKGTHRAVRRAQSFARRWGWFLKCDLRRFYDSIDHAILRDRLHRVIKDRRFQEFLGRIITHSMAGTGDAKGIPIGNLTSQHFANIYLDHLDHFAKEDLRVPGYLRYMDDFLLFADNRRDLVAAKTRINGFLRESLRLQMNHDRTLIGPVWRGLPFLGFQIFPRLIRVRGKNIRRFKRNMYRRLREFERGRTGLRRMQLSVQSMVDYWLQADTHRLRRTILDEVRVDA